MHLLTKILNCHRINFGPKIELLQDYSTLAGLDSCGHDFSNSHHMDYIKSYSEDSGGFRF